MINVIPIETAAPKIIAQNKYAFQSILTTLFLGDPKILKKDFLPTIAMMIVASTQSTMANIAKSMIG